MSDVTDRMGISPIEELLARRADLVKQVAELRALHGPFGTYDALRKIELSKIEAALRAKAVADGVKMTEGAVDAAAHADPRYVEFVTDATIEKARWAVLEDQIEAVNDVILRENAIARFLASEAMLSR